MISGCDEPHAGNLSTSAVSSDCLDVRFIWVTDISRPEFACHHFSNLMYSIGAVWVKNCNPGSCNDFHPFMHYRYLNDSTPENLILKLPHRVWVMSFAKRGSFDVYSHYSMSLLALYIIHVLETLTRVVHVCAFSVGTGSIVG